MIVQCPICNWTPLPYTRWMCPCGYTSHVFDTLGFCPHCREYHYKTQCYRCNSLSDHALWYCGGGDDGRAKKTILFVFSPIAYADDYGKADS